MALSKQEQKDFNEIEQSILNGKSITNKAKNIIDEYFAAWSYLKSLIEMREEQS